MCEFSAYVAVAFNNATKGQTDNYKTRKGVSLTLSLMSLLKIAVEKLPPGRRKDRVWKMKKAVSYS